MIYYVIMTLCLKSIPLLMQEKSLDYLSIILLRGKESPVKHNWDIEMLGTSGENSVWELKCDFDKPWERRILRKDLCPIKVCSDGDFFIWKSESGVSYYRKFCVIYWKIRAEGKHYWHHCAEKKIKKIPQRHKLSTFLINRWSLHWGNWHFG